MPKEKQRQPFSCILDGLQASTGATLGKRNIRMDFSREIVTDDQPVVDVIRRTDDDQEAAGLRYTLNTALIEIMSGITPDRLEQIGRDIASRDVETLFDVQPLSHAQMSG
jgi:formylmethanofuran dehydrogenase subunit E